MPPIALALAAAVPLSTATTICGCVRALLPGEATFNRKLASRFGSSEADIKAALETATALQEEGIVVKALDSKWLTNDRGTKGHVNWVKLKVCAGPCWTLLPAPSLRAVNSSCSRPSHPCPPFLQPDYLKNLEMDAVIIGGWCVHKPRLGWPLP